MAKRDALHRFVRTRKEKEDNIIRRIKPLPWVSWANFLFIIIPHFALRTLFLLST